MEFFPELSLVGDVVNHVVRARPLARTRAGRAFRPWTLSISHAMVAP